MKRILSLSILAFGLLATTGCSETQVILSAEAATFAGLTASSVANPAVARLVAIEIQVACNSVAIPYFSDPTAPMAISSEAVNNLLIQNFTSLSTEAQAIVSDAASILDQFLPIPSPTTFLSKSHIAKLEAFFVGLSNGCGDFLGNRVVIAPKGWHRQTVERHWLNLRGLGVQIYGH